MNDQTPLIEVMIPTFNEESQIQEAVENARHVGPVFILDSLSKDKTREFAAQAGAQVFEHPFENFSKQKNWGLENLPLKGKWVLVMDADERVTPALAEELNRIAADPSALSGYLINQIVIFMGRRIRFGGIFPKRKLMFFRRGQARFEDRTVHEGVVCHGKVGRCHAPMLHVRRETVHEFITKHIKFADLESDQSIRAQLGDGVPERLRPLAARGPGPGDALPKIPWRPVMRFLDMFVLKLGFLDGRAGWHLASLMATYEYMTLLMYREKMQKHLTGESDRSPASAGA
ncbi:MAG: glycosyltransferase family 2 protein [Phycisphaerales bacterium]|nr:glycosyltransferase family 2 protein [Phycisphaerales bacterium]